MNRIAWTNFLILHLKDNKQKPMPDHIIFEKKNSYAVITLDRAEKFNSFIRPMAFEMQKRLDECRQDDEIRAILLRANGKAFCAGQDLKEAADENNGIELEAILSEHYNPIIRKIREIEKPVVCAVNGVAAGAGANIALACDIVLAAKSASFIQAFSKIGLIPDSGGTWILPRLIGIQKAGALMMTGEAVIAEEAERIGMIYKVIPDGELIGEAEKLTILLSNMPTKGLGLTKRALNLSMYNSLDQQLDHEWRLQSEAGSSSDYKEGVQAFLEKRKPEFKGK
jgi:2-(1,2-epoxy-1,2-dihydrophenyl)acetyl-CoA isomerase